MIDVVVEFVCKVRVKGGREGGRREKGGEGRGGRME